MNKFYAIVLFCIPLSAFAGDPIPGIDITVEQSPPGASFSGTTDSNGEITFSGLAAGNYTLTLQDELGSVVLGAGNDDAIVISPGGRSAAIKPIRLELSSYQDGNDIFLRKRPGRSTAVISGSVSRQAVGSAIQISNGPTRATDYNSSRSNKNGSGIAAPTPDSSTDDDCDGVVDIVPADNGTMRISVSCADRAGQ